MKKTFLIAAMIVFFLLLSTQAAFAQSDAPECPHPNVQCVYVDVNRTSGNEDGSPENPYNKTSEGTALAQSYSKGAILFVKEANGAWTQTEVSRVNIPNLGTPLPNKTLYSILAILALVLTIAGWQLMRRSRQVEMEN